MNHLAQLALPEGAKMGGNCGITALAIVSGQSFTKTFHTIAQKKKGNWKGSVYESDYAGYLKLFGVKFERTKETRTLAQFIRHNNIHRDESVYIVFNRNHVMTVKGTTIIDQSGPRDMYGPRDTRASGRFWNSQLMCAYKIVDVTSAEIPAVLAVNPRPVFVQKRRTPASGESKAYRAQLLYAAFKTLGRKTIIEKFIVELDMTAAGAATYYANCKKASENA